LATKRVKRQTQRRKAVRYNLVLNKDKWVRGSDQIKKLRDELSTGSCPVTGTAYTESGMDSSCLDHCHVEGVVRGVLSARSNLWLGSIEKYMKNSRARFSIYLNPTNKLDDFASLEECICSENVGATAN
jgi:hypothetical protein